MDVQAKRLELVKWILNVQEETLSKISLLKETTANEIVSFLVNEAPLAKNAYTKKIKDAEQRIDSGAYTSHNDLGKEMQNW